MSICKSAAFAAILTGIAPAPFALAEATTHGHDGATAAIGSPGGTPSRTVTVTMNDNYYEPESISIAQGETVRFVLENDGIFLHEFNIATPAMHVAHQPHMAMMVEMGALKPDRIDRAVINASKGTSHDMSHDDPNSALVEPGQTKEIVWTFDTDVDLEFACNIPGHYDAGMAGDFAIHH